MTNNQTESAEKMGIKGEGFKLQKRALQFLLSEKKIYAGCTEYHFCHGICDIFGFTETLFSHDFEIKVAMGDLCGELNAIDAVLGNEMPKKSARKYTKHWNLLNPKGKTWRDPNYFSFIVPEEFSGRAMETLRKTPFGLLIYYKDIDIFTWLKQPTRMHNEKLDAMEIITFSRACSWRAYNFS